MIRQFILTMKKFLLAVSRLSILVALCAGFVRFASSAHAQSTSTWSPPTNLSNSGFASGPLLVADSNGTLHTMWIDQFEGYKYSKSTDGVSWSAPKSVRFPFVPDPAVQPLLLADQSGGVHAFWRTLKNELERGGQRRRLPAKECVGIAKALAGGLRVLHESGFTHRDIRPSNIIFVNNVPKLADIDLLAGHDSTLTSFIPKDYAAPAGSHSSQADIYSFGKTLYEICTGQPVQAYPSLPTDIRFWEDHLLLLRINKVILKACALDARKRYPTAGHLADDVEGIL